MNVRALVLLPLLAATAAPLEAAPRRRASRPAPATAAPSASSRELPRAPQPDARCPASSTATTRWLSSSRQPWLLATRDGARSAAGCCAAFARKGSSWLSVDARGAVVGEARVTGGARDASGCFELDLQLLLGAPGVGLWVERPRGWDGALGDLAPAPDALGKASRRWVAAPFTPPREALAELSDLVDELTVRLTLPARCAAPDDRLPLARRTLGFKQAGAGDGDAVDTVAIGGHLLVVASREGRGWRVRHVELAGADRCSPRAYLPLAAIDLDADGAAELVVRHERGEERRDLVLAWDDARDGLRIVAR